jgi:transposase
MRPSLRWLFNKHWDKIEQNRAAKDYKERHRIEIAFYRLKDFRRTAT